MSRSTDQRISRTEIEGQTASPGQSIITPGALVMALAILFSCTPVNWADQPTVVLGLGSPDAAKYNVEFMRYDRMVPLFEKHQIQASLMEYEGLFRANWTEQQLYEMFSCYHVITFGTSSEGVYRLDSQWRKRADVVGNALARYVRDGGGLFLLPHPVRYPGSDDEKYWNLVFAPFALKILHEGVFDKTRSFTGKTVGDINFWFTRNIQSHRVTAGVAGLCLPQLSSFSDPGIPAIEYSPDWTILVRGEKEARSYRSGADNVLNLDAQGKYTTEPPVFGVRTLGKGRVACYPIPDLFTGVNYENPLWSHIVESKGSPGRPSDSMKMMINTYRWLGEPAMSITAFGIYRPEPYQAASFPASKELSQGEMGMSPESVAAARQSSVRAVVGAHSAYTDGKATVAQYVKAAKAAGVSCIVFADPLEKLTPETLKRLQVECARASKAGDFYACPGIEFSDGIGNRWAFWGEKVVWPDATFKWDNFTYVQWDGKRVNQFGQFAETCGHPGSALLDYRQLRKNGAHPENLWWFFHYFPLVYDHGQLVADNYADYLFGLRDMRWAAISSFTRITEPTEVAQAADLCVTIFNSLHNAKAALNSRTSAYGVMNTSAQYVTQGPVIVTWRALNNQRAGNVKTMRGVQRVRLYFDVRSDAGIAEVKVHDADRGPIRRFQGHGKKQLARDFELVHDQQRYLTLEVVDQAGNRDFSRFIFVYCYKSGLFRCSDNLNILGPTAMYWHPDRNQFFPAAKDFRNGHDFHLRGYDTASSTLGVPTPKSYLLDMIHIKEKNGDKTVEYPHPSTLNAIRGRLMDVGINNADHQIATLRMTKLSQRYDTAARPTPALATVPRDTGAIEIFEHTHTLYAPMERVDMFIAWDFRRDKESRQHYRGGILWHEGQFRFKRDVTLQGDLPIHLYWERAPVDIQGKFGTTLTVTDADGTTRVEEVSDIEQPLRISGWLRPGGYVAWRNFPVGYHAFLSPVDMNFRYVAKIPDWAGLKVGLGEAGQNVKAGTVLRYRFGVATFTDSQANNDLLEQTVTAMNLGGGHAGYPVQMKVGKLKDAVFFFTAAADHGEAMFTLGPQSLIIDLPIRVQGLADNGCAAIYSSKVPRFRFIPVDSDGTAWLTEPIDRRNEMWIGNILVAKNEKLRMTVVVDGQAEGLLPLVEVHNPTEQTVST